MKISTVEEEEISEEEVEEPLEEEDVATSTSGETTITTISIHTIKEEVETILAPTTVAEEEVITTKRGQIMVAIIVESTGTKQLIVDTNIRQTWQRIHINTLVSLLKINIVYFRQAIHFQKKKTYGIWTLGVVIICVGKRNYFLL